MIKKEMIAMLLAGGQGSRLGVLTSKVAKPAVAFGGKYRIIDFPLSNCRHFLRLGGYGPAGRGRGLHGAGKRAGADGSEHRKHPSRGVGDWRELKELYSGYQNAFVYTTKHDLEDSFDWEGMQEGGRQHALVDDALLEELKQEPEPHDLSAATAMTISAISFGKPWGSRLKTISWKSALPTRGNC